MSLRSELAEYRNLPRLAGGWRMTVSFLGRLPTSMVVIGMLMLSTYTLGSIAQGSIVSASLAISTGIGQPMIGRITDRLGQRDPLLVFGILNAVFLSATVTMAALGAGLSVLVLFAILVGLTTTPVGALARVRWYYLAKRPPELATALSWESTIDEMGYVLGPAVVGITSSFISPYAPLAVSAFLAATSVTGFAMSKNAVGPSLPTEGNHLPPFGHVMKAIIVTLVSMGALGMFFGVMQTTTTANAEAMRNTSAAGLIYAALGLGAAVTSLGAVAIPERVSLVTRIVLGGFGIAAGALLCLIATTPLGLAVLMFVTGMAIGPASVAIFTLASRLSSKGGDAVAVTLLGAINVLGVAFSSAINGQLLEIRIAYGYIFACACGILMAFGALMNARRR